MRFDAHSLTLLGELGESPKAQREQGKCLGSISNWEDCLLEEDFMNPLRSLSPEKLPNSEIHKRLRETEKKYKY